MLQDLTQFRLIPNVPLVPSDQQNQTKLQVIDVNPS